MNPTMTQGNRTTFVFCHLSDSVAETPSTVNIETQILLEGDSLRTGGIFGAGIATLTINISAGKLTTLLGLDAHISDSSRGIPAQV